MHRIHLAFTALLLAVACDPSATTANKADASAAQDGKTPAEPTAATPPVAPHVAPPPGTFATLSECVDSCDGAKLAPTDRATCRLNCDAAFRPRTDGDKAGSDANNPIVQTAECLGRCYGAGGAVEPCVGACKASVAGISSPPSAALLDSLDSCVRTCHADSGVLPTNRKTCELNCAQTARVAPSTPPATTPPAATPPATTPSTTPSAAPPPPPPT